MKKEKGVLVGKVVALSAGVAALGAATYYFFGPEGKKHQKNFKSWMLKMKADIVEKIEEAEEVTESLYHKIIDEIAVGYIKAGKASKEEVAVYADALKKQWKHISKAAKPVKKSVKKEVKKLARPIGGVVKQVAKKVAKVATKVAKKK
ncbi:MAG: hypothetical protein WCG84_01135 [Candidatus Moraniibacteriota bacterium]